MYMYIGLCGKEKEKKEKKSSDAALLGTAR
jgi:hypothetical protein